MPENYYEASNTFELYDVEGVILPSPNDFILIREPENFKKTGIKLKRSDNHGFDYEYSDSETPYGFDRVVLSGQPNSPFDILFSIFSIKGVDGKAIVRFKRNGILQYEGDLDFETLKVLDYKLTLSSRRINLDDLFRTRLETPVNFSATTSIDGTAIGGISPVDMFLHSKVISQEAKCKTRLGTFFTIVRLGTCGSTTTTNMFWEKVEDGITYENGDKSFIQEQQNLSQYWPTPFTDYRFNSYYVLNRQETTYQIDVSIVINGNFGSSNNNSSLILYLTQDLDGVLSRTQIFNDSTTTGVTKGISVNFTGTIFKESTDNLPTDLYIEALMPDFPCDNVSGMTVNIPGATFDITASFENERSFAEVYNPFDAFNHILEVINNEDNLLISDFWSNVGNEIYVTNGYKIRNLPTRNVITSFEEMFNKWALPSFGLGFAVVDSGGTAKVLMERYDHFYQDVEIDAFTVIEDDEFEISIDKELIFNELEVGYKDFPKSTDENKSSNIDEFNTIHNVLTPIKTVKNKASYVSDTISSGYKIENQRIEQYKDEVLDTVSDDDKQFCIKGRSITSFDTTAGNRYDFNAASDLVILEQSYTPVIAGDIITISGATLGNGIYTVLDATVGLYDTGSVRYIGLILTTTAVVFTGGNSNSINVAINSTRLVAERNEAFDVLTNVISPETIYNVGLNPAYMRANQSLLLNSGFNPKPGSDVLKVQDVKLNGDMSCQFKVGEGGYILDPDQQLVTMDGDTQLSDFNLYNKLFSGALIKFRTTITYGRVLNIRAACLNEEGAKDYGYITMTTPSGGTLKGFIMTMEYNPMSEQVDFLLRQKFDPEGGAFDYILDAVMN